MRIPTSALALVLAALAGAGAGGAVAYNQVVGSPSARMEAPSATTTAPTIQTDPTAPAPTPQGPPVAQAEAPKAQPSGQAPSSNQPHAGDVTELQKQVENHEQRIEQLEQGKQASAQDAGNATANNPTSEKPTAPVENPASMSGRPEPVPDDHSSVMRGRPVPIELYQ